MLTVHDIRELFKVAPEVAGTKELIGVSFKADENSIFGVPDYDYIRREINWYLSMDSNVLNMEEPVPTIWKDVCDKDGHVNSNYGKLVFSGENEFQYISCVTTLKRDLNSRQAVMIYTNPSMHTQAHFNGRRDFVCTNTVQALVRDGKLNFVVNMRSNDAVFGYKNDIAWQRYVQSKMATELGIPVGDIYWQVGSLHVYKRHYHLIGE